MFSVMIEQEGYKIATPDAIETPALVVFEAVVDHNVAAMTEEAGRAERIMPHVKTHKSDAVVRKQLEAGVAGFKCATIKELEMVLEAGACEAILSYPLVQESKVERFADLVSAFAQARIHAIVSSISHVEVLAFVAEKKSVKLRVMLDLDAGQHRTGVEFGEPATLLYKRIADEGSLEGSGFHIYDGHEHFGDYAQRQAAANCHIDAASELKLSLESAGMEVERIVGGSSFSYPFYAHADGMHGSPGTCIYWDTGYQSVLPEAPFRFAALVLSQVVDRHPDQKTFTTDLGIKGISGDPPLANRAHLLGETQVCLVKQNEEHGVFACDEELPQIGTYLLAAPGHVCTTTVRYPGSFVIGDTGQIVDYYPHTARDRH